MMILVSSFGDTDCLCSADLSADGDVNISDILILAGVYGNECQEQELYGINVELISTIYTIIQNPETGFDSQTTITIQIAITAFGDDMGIAKNTNYSGFSNLVWLVVETGDGFMVSSMTSSADIANNAYQIQEGYTETFTFTSTLIPIEGGYFQVGLIQLMYRLPDGTEVYYPEGLLGEFVSPVIFLDPGDPEIIILGE